MEVPRLNYDPEVGDDEAPMVVGPDAAAGDPEYAECARAAGRSASWCRSVAVTVRSIFVY